MSKNLPVLFLLLFLMLFLGSSLLLVGNGFSWGALIGSLLTAAVLTLATAGSKSGENRR